MTPRVVLVEPTPGARISGGYLYNARMAAYGAFSVVNCDAARLTETVASLEADVVLADSIWLTEAASPPFVARARAGKTTGALMHSFPSMIEATEAGRPPPAAPTAFEIATLEQLGLVVTPGPHYAALLKDRAVRVLECPPGIDPALKQAPRERSGPCELITLGAVTQRKGVRDVLEILSGYVGDYRYRVVGSLDADRDYARACQGLAAELPQVELLGQRAPDEVVSLLRRAHVLVMPSYDENHPLVLLEALAASVPSVAYAAGAARSMVRHETEGLVVPIGDRSALRDALFRLIEQESERARLAAGCFARQNSLLDWPEAADAARRTLAQVS